RCNRRRHVASGSVLDVRVWQFVLLSIRELDVSNRARRLLHLSSDALVAFAAETNGPLDLLTLSKSGRPRRADGGEVITEDVSRPTAIRPMNDEDIRVGKRHP